jgi:hypothetical protein
VGSESYLQKAYLFIGGTFSVFYVVLGLLLCTGRMTLGMEPSMRFLVGAGILAYGIFRAFVFYRKYKASKEEEQN